MTTARTRFPGLAARLDEHLEVLSELWAPGWLMLAEFRKGSGGDPARIENALRRAVEEMPGSKDAWLARAQNAKDHGDDATMIAALVSAVDTDPSDVPLIRDTAVEVCKYVYDRKRDIPTVRRGVYLASIREHMVRVSDKLDATGLSRLAWLYLLENNEAEARRYCNDGLRRDPDNEHCVKMRNRLDESRSSP